jgi:hypothetical protein
MMRSLRMTSIVVHGKDSFVPVAAAATVRKAASRRGIKNAAA